MKVNLSYLEDITGGDTTVIIEMLDLFIQDIPKHTSNMVSFFQEGKLLDLAREAHMLKPTVQYVGLYQMYEDLKEIEALARKEVKVDKISELLDSIKTEAKTSVPALKAKREELA
ncbi:MAG: Hpt domain-containing protein [Balneolaceae bacterium]|nr:Hpt domain-containing protein [Balneolaceae bacterium]